MNESERGGRATGEPGKRLIPLAMMFIVIGSMCVVVFSTSSGPHGGTVLGLLGVGEFGRGLFIGLGIAFEIVGLVIAIRAATQGAKTGRG